MPEVRVVVQVRYPYRTDIEVIATDEVAEWGGPDSAETTIKRESERAAAMAIAAVKA